MKSYDVIVVGAGGIGTATMCELARRGLRVLGIDRFSPPHVRGSTHGETRIIRQAYFEHPDYVPLLWRTYEHWNELQQATGARLFTRCGLVEAGPADGEVVAGVLRAAREHTLEVEQLSADEIAKRWPALRLPDDMTAVFEPTAGYLLVERCVEELLQQARQHGAELLTDCEVIGWQASDKAVEVATSEGSYSAASMVVTAGAWAADLLDDLGVPLTVLRKTLFWYPAAGVERATELPAFLYEFDFGVPYGFPVIDGLLMKVAVHNGGAPVDDPLRSEDQVDSHELGVTQRFLSQCVVGAGDTPTASSTCLYTMTPDSHFIVDRHPKHANVVFAAGLSGHGYKFAPVLGEALADLVVAGKSELSIDFLGLHRFKL